MVTLIESDLISIFTSLLFKEANLIPSEFSLDIVITAFKLYQSVSNDILDCSTLTPCTRDLFTGYSIGGFLRYTFEYLKVVSRDLQAITRNDAFKAFSCVIKEYVANFTDNEIFNGFVLKSLSSMDSIDQISHESLKKVIRQSPDTENFFSKYVNSTADDKLAYWPPNTEVKSVKTYITFKKGLNTLPDAFNHDLPSFWRDVQKLCSLSLVKKSIAIVLDHPGPTVIRSLLQVASLLNCFEIVCLDFSGNVDEFICNLGRLLIQLYLSTIQSPEHRTTAIWHIHFNECKGSADNFNEVVRAITTMVSNPLSRTEIVQEFYSQSGKKDIDYSELMNLIEFMSRQTLLFSYPIKGSSPFKIDAVRFFYCSLHILSLKYIYLFNLFSEFFKTYEGLSV